MGETQISQNKPKKIGAISNKINYPPDQKFFHQSDIPTHIKQTVDHVKTEIDPDILGRRKVKWNQSVSLVPAPVIDTQADLFKVRTGLGDTKFVKTKEQLVYQGAETRDDYTGWNVSTELIGELERDRVIEEETLQRQAKTSITNEALLQEREYKNPVQITKEYNQKLREEKEQDNIDRDSMISSVEKEMP